MHIRMVGRKYGILEEIAFNEERLREHYNANSEAKIDYNVKISLFISMRIIEHDEIKEIY